MADLAGDFCLFFGSPPEWPRAGTVTRPATVEYDPIWGPRVTLTADEDGGFTAVIEVAGNAPQRGTTAEEREAGITSLDPPTVVVSALETPYDTHRALIDGAWRAVASAASSTTGESGGPGGLIMTCLRVTMTMRHALRLLDEEI